MNSTLDIVYKTASTKKELLTILELQECNHYSNLSGEEQQSNGFLTVRHDIKLLEEMNAACPHIIAVSDENVVGYALCMLPFFRNRIPVLLPMFKLLDRLLLEKNENIDDYVIMGQICISKSFRKKGIFRGLYDYMGTILKKDYKGIITEVAVSNTISLQAHHAVGFKSMHRHWSGGQEWDLIWLPFN